MQRIIAYIYRYKEDKGSFDTNEEIGYARCGNAGFCRVEICDDKCTVAICFKDICKVSGKCNIYGLVANESQQDMQKCYQVKDNLGSKNVSEGQMNARVNVSGTNGILIECENCKYVALWNETVDRLYFQQEVQNEVEKEDVKQEQLKVEMERGDVKQEQLKEEKRKEDVKQERLRTEMENREIKQASDNSVMLERAYNRLCKVRMIIGGKTYQVVKMRPQDIIMLPRSYWRLANNLFLMDGYYMYKHIIFFKYEEQYVLGVPGKGSLAESAYAIKFGFCESVTGSEYGRQIGDRTYWLMRLA